MKAKSIKGKSTKEIYTALEESMQDGFRPTLAIVFFSISHDREELCNILDSHDISIFGATTHGEFIDEVTETGSIAILLLAINKSSFKIMFEEYPERNYREITQNIARKSLGLFSTPAFLIASSNMNINPEELLLGFSDVVGESVNVFGGMAGDEQAFKEQFVITNGKSSNNGLVVLVLDEDKLEIKGVATCGWKAVGTEKTVTKSEGNHVFTVDDIPVLDLTIKYGGLDDLKEDNIEQAIEIGTNFPLQLQRETGNPVMRPGLRIDWNDHSFYCSGPVPQGSKVRFSLPPDFDVVDKVINELEKLKNNEMPEADALVVFSCAGRIFALGPLMNKEIEGIRGTWEVPMAGMFSTGELARATGGNLEMHNLTTCCIALKEK